jgi:hypothetical protein
MAEFCAAPGPSSNACGDGHSRADRESVTPRLLVSSPPPSVRITLKNCHAFAVVSQAEGSQRGKVYPVASASTETELTPATSQSKSAVDISHIASAWLDKDLGIATDGYGLFCSPQAPSHRHSVMVFPLFVQAHCHSV